MLNELAHRIRADNAAKGFGFPEREVDKALLLIVSEICEAQDELRAGHDIDEVYFPGNTGKPEGFPVEIADALIRILDLCAMFDFDIDHLVEEKLAYNKSRPPKHGKAF